MSSTVSMRPIFDLGPRCAEGACSDMVATAAFRQTRADDDDDDDDGLLLSL
jgi:hypothetical protein